MAELQIEHTPASYSTHHSHHKKTSKAEGNLLRVTEATKKHDFSPEGQPKSNRTDSAVSYRCELYWCTSV
ncbi:hypothetical protein PGT21_016452 [Puccinia graminis f. sp. tritici]|uniref:Uncharacterized protein n=1 Tax=Puccinia graminis f. sp. tritici TaxID=56615 RepID=A0A5B0PRM7_PUCGR|nr:hypothetical protein PGT21_016452 [Puccinia graminis f. sp. tritici]